MGAGKSSIGKELAQSLGWVFYDSDQLIENRAGVDLLWIYDIEGEKGVRCWEQKVIAELVKKPNIVLATGGNTVNTPGIQNLLFTYGLIVYLQTSLDYQLIRTGYSKKRPLSTQTEKRREALQKLNEQNIPIYQKLADIVCSTDSYSTKSAVCSELLQLVKKSGAIDL